ASRTHFARSSRAARATAFPPTTAARLANVPTPCPMPSVSPPMTLTSSGVTPSSSAAIWASVVSSPCPCDGTPVKTEMRPAASARIVAPSKGPTPVSFDVACDTEAKQATLPASAQTFLGEALVVRHLQGAAEHGRVVSAVVDDVAGAAIVRQADVVRH